MTTHDETDIDHAVAALKRIADDENETTQQRRLAANDVIRARINQRNIRLKEEIFEYKQEKEKPPEPPKDENWTNPEVLREGARRQFHQKAVKDAYHFHLERWRAIQGGARLPPDEMMFDPCNYHPLPDTYLPDPEFHTPENRPPPLPPEKEPEPDPCEQVMDELIDEFLSPPKRPWEENMTAIERLPVGIVHHAIKRGFDKEPPPDNEPPSDKEPPPDPTQAGPCASTDITTPNQTDDG